MSEFNRFKLGPATAYALAKANGFDGTQEEWLDSLKGEKGDPGTPGKTPVRGVDYWTAEDIASMKGEKGDPGAGVPTVTTANNGQFLRVVNGAWAASTVPNAEEASF